MSPVKKSPHNLTAISIAITAVIVFGAATLSAQTSRRQLTLEPVKPTRDIKRVTIITPDKPPFEPQHCPEIKLSCRSPVAAGSPVSCSATLSFQTNAEKTWSVMPRARITKDRRGLNVSISTANVSQERLTVTFSIPQFGPNCVKTDVVEIKPRVIPPKEETKRSCPQITISCTPSPVVVGKDVSCSVSLSGGTKGAQPTYSWSVRPYRVVQEMNSSTMSVNTAGMKAKTLSVTLNLGGYGLKCGDKSEVSLEQPVVTPPSPEPPPPSPTTPSPETPIPTTPSAETPTSPTQPVTPTAETPTSTGGGIITTPSPSPTAPGEPSPGSSVSPTAIDRLWPWILGVAIVALAATFLIARRFLRGGGAQYDTARYCTKCGAFNDGTAQYCVTCQAPLPPAGGYQPMQSIPESTQVAESQQRLDALIAGAQRKQDEDVSCTVFAPHEAGRGDGFLVQAFAHLPKQASMLEDIAKQADQAAAYRGSTTLLRPIERGEQLGFYLQMPGLDIDEPQQSVPWMAKIGSVKFGVIVPVNFKPRSVNCKLSVSRQNVPIGHVRFNFKISDAPQPAEKAAPPEPHPDFVRYKLAFISYASADRSEVMKRVQMLDLVKIKYFQDLLSLEAGKQWEPLIYRYIDECDVFCLFWSSAAKKSKWVKKEVQRALQRKGNKLEGPPEILPIPIEGPPPVEPLPYLASIHFDSKFLYFINPRS